MSDLCRRCSPQEPQLFSPKINHNSQRRTVHDLYVWKQRRDQKVEQLNNYLNQLKEEEYLLLRQAPSIDHVSQMLQEANRPRVKVEDLLMKKGLYTQQKLLDKSIEYYSQFGSPKVNKTKLKRDENVFSRLYDIAQKKQQEKQAQQQPHTQSQSAYQTKRLSNQQQNDAPIITPAIYQVLGRMQSQKENIYPQQKLACTQVRAQPFSQQLSTQNTNKPLVSQHSRKTSVNSKKFTQY